MPVNVPAKHTMVSRRAWANQKAGGKLSRLGPTCSGAEEGTRTPTPLRVHGPEPCASANSATSASVCFAGRLDAALMEETTPSILQRRQGVSNLGCQWRCMPSSSRKSLKAATRSKSTKAASSIDSILELRSLAHDLSNSLEAILQATYLLSHAKLDADSRRWLQLIDQSSQDAARINREIRKLLRNLSGEEAIR